VRGPCVRGQYLHWDELRRRTPPEGLSHEEWWFGLTVQRDALERSLPLLDNDERAFKYVLVDPIPERLHEIDLGAGGKIAMPDPITNPHTKDHYYVGSLIEEAITSSQLEGATTTRQVAKEMIRAGRRPRDRSEQMILNNFLTMKRIGALRGEHLSKELVFELHRLVTDDTLDDPSAAGRFRRSSEEVVVGGENDEIYHVPPAAETLEARLERMCAFANDGGSEGFVHPAIRSIILHFWLAYDHPFVDGNGRTARALFYWSMLRHGYWLFEFISISHMILKAPSQYYLSFLYTEKGANDLTYFILYHAEIIRRAIEELHRYIGRKTAELELVEAELKGIHVLNHRQRALISHALRHPNHAYSIESHRHRWQVAYQTARTDLLDLHDRGLLKKQQAGKRLLFSPVADMREQLAEVG
jgi:Fic family protein